MKISKKHEKILKHFINCGLKRKCLHCADGFALAINIRNVEYQVFQDSLTKPAQLLNEVVFNKFLEGFNKGKLPCMHAVDLSDFIKFILKLNKEELSEIKEKLMCHIEFDRNLADKPIYLNPI